MGKINKGILGGFSGKVGTVVGAFWKGIAYMRSLAGSIHNPKTTKQTQQRMKFAMLSTFLSHILGVLKVGFKNKAVQMTEMDAAFKHNFPNVIGGSYPTYSLLYDKVEISSGKLDNPYSPNAVVESNTVTVSWTDNSGIGIALATDEAIVLAHNSVKSQAVHTIAGGKRSERQATLTLPSAWSGDSIDVWFAMRNPDTGECSTSLYLGNFSI